MASVDADVDQTLAPPMEAGSRPRRREVNRTEFSPAGLPAARAVNSREIERGTPLSKLATIESATWRGKRVLDIVGATALAIVFSPIIFAITVWLAASGGSVFFGQTRIGYRGRRFTCYKFRTMVRDADSVLHELLDRRHDLRDEWLRDHKLRNDPRVTRIGSILRKTSLDELPQLWNILRGDMSLVGPRPIVQTEIARYRRSFRYYVASRPGLTGLWQVRGRSDTTYRRRVAMDRYYTRRSRLSLDLAVILITVKVVLARAGAY